MDTESLGNKEGSESVRPPVGVWPVPADVEAPDVESDRERDV